MKTWHAPDLSHPMLQKAYAFGAAAHAAVGQFRKYSKDDAGNPIPYIVHPVECVAILQSVNATLAMQCGMMEHDTVEDTRQFVDEAGNVVKETGSFVKNGRTLTLKEGITLKLIGDVFDDPQDHTFGPEVVRIVSGLTDVSMPWDGNRAARKAIDLAHTAEQKPDVKTCKLADLISNAPSIIEHDPGFAHRWMNEKQALLEVLKDGGDPTLFAIASDIMADYLKR